MYVTKAILTRQIIASFLFVWIALLFESYTASLQYQDPASIDIQEIKIDIVKLRSRFSQGYLDEIKTLMLWYFGW